MIKKLIKHKSKWLLLIVGLSSLAISVLALRSNNQQMLYLREAVIVADKNNGDIEGALRDLREYIYSHMNTDLTSGDNSIKPPIQLKYHYERLVEAEKARQKAINTSNNTLYNDAQNYCEDKIKAFFGRDKLDCVRQYLEEHKQQSEENIEDSDIHIPDELYKFDFVSPRWSPDLAGWSLVIGFTSIFIFIVRILIEKLIKNKLRF